MRTASSANKYLSISLAVILTVSGIWFILQTWKSAEKEQSNNIFRFARTYAHFLPIQDIEKLNASPEDTQKAEYKNLKNHLSEIVSVDKNIRFAYVWTLRDNNIYFIADSEPTSSQDYSPPGQEYSEAKPEDKKPFIDGKEYITSALTDRWGTWRSVYIPLKNESGKLNAVMGLDFDAKLWKKNVLSIIIESVLLVIIIVILFLIIFNIYFKNKSLRHLLKERQNAENALIESEKKFRNLVEATSDIIWETNIERKYTYLSPQTESILGFKPHELLGKTPFENMSPDEAKRVISISDGIVTTKEPFNNLYNTVISKNGKEVILETSGVPILDEKGELQGYRGVDRDITERKQNDEIILSTNKKLKLLLEVAGEGIIGVDSTGNITFANTKAYELLEYKADEMIGKNSHALFHHSHQDGSPFPSEECPNYSTLKNGQHIIGEDYYWKKNGEGFHVAFSSAPMFENDEIIGLVITFIDISSKKQAEFEIKAKSEELQRFNKLMVNREQKMIELKKEINELLVKMGKPEKYKNRMD